MTSHHWPSHCVLQEEVDDGDDNTDFSFRRSPQPQMLQDIHNVGGGLQGLLSQLFQSLLPEIESLILFGEKLDS